MANRSRSSNPKSWLVVALVGVIVLVVVFGLQLFPRLDDGQAVVDGLEPAVQPDRVATARGGVTIVSDIVDLADPLVLASGGAAAEVPALVAFVASGTGLTEAEVVAALGTSFPHVLALLQALPLETAAAELPALVTLIATTLNLPEADVLAALDANFPRLAQVVAALPMVTSGWADVPNTPGTRFDGAEITTAADVRNYFRDDIVPVLETQGENLRNVADVPGGVGFLPLLLLVVGVVAVVYGVLMMVLSSMFGTPRGQAMFCWAIVVIVGIFVELVVFGFQLFPRLGDAQTVIDNAKPALTADRVATQVGGISLVSSVVDTADPIVLASGGAAAEVPLLVQFVASGSGLAPDAVAAAIGQTAPHVLALLQALPLEAVNAELPGLITFLATNLGLSEADVLAALTTNFPRLAQSITALPVVVSGWENVPNTPGTRFNGTPVDAVPDVRDYFKDDVIAAVAANREAFDNLESTWPPTTYFPPLLAVVGALVILYGLLMFFKAKNEGDTPTRRGGSGGDWSG